jgi:hypothetical protein
MDDIKKFEGREPDARDLEALENGSYVVVLGQDDKEQLYHQAFLRATKRLKVRVMEMILHCVACALIGAVGARLIGLVWRGRRHHEPRMICGACQARKSSSEEEQRQSTWIRP